MKQNLTIFAVAAMLVFSLVACSDTTNDNMAGNGTDGTTDNSMTGAAGTYAAGATGANGALGTDTPYAGVDGGVYDDVDGRLVRYGNGFGNTGAQRDNTNATANSKLHGSYNNPTGTMTGGATATVMQEEDVDPVAPRVRYELMLDNARVHDTDGFLLDGENSRHSTF